MTTPLRPTRYPERTSNNRNELNRILDDNLTCVLSSIVEDAPWALPLLYARIGDDLVIHGSTGGGLLRHVAQGAPVVLTVHKLNGLVLAATPFNTSANYDSAVVTGSMRTVEGDEKHRLTLGLMDVVAPGRLAELPPVPAQHWAATLTLALKITEDNWLVKSRSGPPTASDDPSLTMWQGVLPVRQVWGPAEYAYGDDTESATVAHYVT